MKDTLITCGGTRCIVLTTEAAEDLGMSRLTTPISISKEGSILASIAASLAAGTGYRWCVTIKAYEGSDCATVWRDKMLTHDEVELAANRDQCNPLNLAKAS